MRTTNPIPTAFACADRDARPPHLRRQRPRHLRRQRSEPTVRASVRGCCVTWDRVLCASESARRAGTRRAAGDLERQLRHFVAWGESGGATRDRGRHDRAYRDCTCVQ